MHCVSLHGTELHWTALHYMALNYTALLCNDMHCTVLHKFNVLSPLHLALQPPLHPSTKGPALRVGGGSRGLQTNCPPPSFLVLPFSTIFPPFPPPLSPHLHLPPSSSLSLHLPFQLNFSSPLPIPPFLLHPRKYENISWLVKNSSMFLLYGPCNV